jgi:hypothetical protein
VQKNTMTTFKSTFEKYNWDEIQSKIYASIKTSGALAKSKRDLDDFSFDFACSNLLRGNGATHT